MKNRTYKIISVTLVLIMLSASLISCSSNNNIETYIPEDIDLKFGMNTEQVKEAVEKSELNKITEPDYNFVECDIDKDSGDKIYTLSQSDTADPSLPTGYYFYFRDDSLYKFQIPCHTSSADKLIDEINKAGFEPDIDVEQLQKTVDAAKPPYDEQDIVYYTVTSYDDKNNKIMYKTELTNHDPYLDIPFLMSYSCTSESYE